MAILACGPSVRETWTDEFFDDFPIVIAVNDAAWPRPGTDDRPFRHHWVVGSDAHILTPILKGERPRPHTGALTNRAYGPQFERLGLLYVRPHTFNKGGPLGARHTSYSFVAAVWFALENAGPLGHVHIHGFDASVTPSVTGIDKNHSHKNARWRAEADLLRMVWDDSRITNYGRASTLLLDHIAGRKSL